MGAPQQPRSRFAEELPRHLDRWVASSLISRAQADAIRAIEEPVARPRRIPLVTEALGYLGAALAIAAAVVIMAEAGVDLTLRQWTAVFGGAAILLFLGGWWPRASKEPAVGRLCSLLWFLSVVGAAVFISLLGVDVGNPDPDSLGEVAPIVLAAASGGTLYAGWLFAMRRRTLQHVALFGGLIATFVGAVMTGAGDDWGGGHTVVLSIALWALGAFWLYLATGGLLRPPPVGQFLASALLLVAPAILSEEARGAGLLLGLATAGGLMVVSVLANRPLVLWVGSVGLFAYLVGIIGVYLSDTLGLPLALLLSGLVLLALAVVTGRLKRLTGQPSAAEPFRA